jgi:hypothetical protein
MLASAKFISTGSAAVNRLPSACLREARETRPLPGAECEHFRAQAGRVVGDRDARQIGLAGAREIGVDFDGGEQLLPGAGQRDQRGQRLDFGKERAPRLRLAAHVQLHVFGLERKDIAVGAEHAVRRNPAHMLDIDARREGRRVIGGHHLIDIGAFDLAAIGGRAFGRHAEKLGARRHAGFHPGYGADCGGAG